MGQLLYDLGAHHLNEKEYAQVALFLRTAAEYYNHRWAQNYLGVLYNLGQGVEQSDLAALYWFDRAADNDIEEAKTDRECIPRAYCTGANGNMAESL